MKKSLLKNKFTPLSLGIYIFLILWSIVFFLLMAWGLMTSFKGSRDFLNHSVFALPTEWTFDNYTFVFQNYYVRVTTSEGIKKVWLEEMAVNSILYATLKPLGSLIMSAWVAYLTAKFKYKFSSIVNAAVISLLIIPIIGTSASTIVLLKKLGIYGTISSNVLLSFHFIDMNYLIFHAMLASQPKDFDEAALIDGAGFFTIFWHISFPSIAGVFFVFFIRAFMSHWNDYGGPLLFLPAKPTLAYGVYALDNSTLQGFNYVPVKLSTNFMLAVPMIAVFSIFSKKLIMKMNFSLGELK